MQNKLEEEKGQRGKVKWWTWGQKPGLDKQPTCVSCLRISLYSWGLHLRVMLIIPDSGVPLISQLS